MIKVNIITKNGEKQEYFEHQVKIRIEDQYFARNLKEEDFKSITIEQIGDNNDK